MLSCGLPVAGLGCSFGRDLRGSDSCKFCCARACFFGITSHCPSAWAWLRLWGCVVRLLPDGVHDVCDEDVDMVEDTQVLDDGKLVIREGQQDAVYKAGNDSIGALSEQARYVARQALELSGLGGSSGQEGGACEAGDLGEATAAEESEEASASDGEPERGLCRILNDAASVTTAAASRAGPKAPTKAPPGAARTSGQLDAPGGKASAPPSRPQRAKPPTPRSKGNSKPQPQPQASPAKSESSGAASFVCRAKSTKDSQKESELQEKQDEFEALVAKMSETEGLRQVPVTVSDRSEFEASCAEALKGAAALSVSAGKTKVALQRRQGVDPDVLSAAEGLHNKVAWLAKVLTACSAKRPDAITFDQACSELMQHEVSLPAAILSHRTTLLGLDYIKFKRIDDFVGLLDHSSGTSGLQGKISQEETRVLNSQIVEKAFFKLSPASGRFPLSSEELQETLLKLVTETCAKVDMEADKKDELLILAATLDESKSNEDRQESVSQLMSLPEGSMLHGLVRTQGFSQLATKIQSSLEQSSKLSHKRSKIMECARKVHQLADSPQLDATAAAQVTESLLACVPYVNSCSPALGATVSS